MSLVWLVVAALLTVTALPRTSTAEKLVQEPSVKRVQAATLFYSKECQDDIGRYCSNSRKTELSDLAVLQCIHNEVSDLNTIDKECHNLLYAVKKNMTVNLRLDSTALQICKNDLEKMTECQNVEKEKNGHLLSCILDNKENVTESNCRSFLTSVAALVFSDYRLVSNFILDCGSDIERFSCGRLEKEETAAPRPTQQGKTIECLTLKYAELGDQCRKQITRVVELQSDDFHLDRPLYFACRGDRERFCLNIVAGNGAVYRCLMQHKFDSLMSSDCRDQLTRRQQVIVEDAFADRTLIRACKKDLQNHKCRSELRDGNDVKFANPIKLANVLLCLESAIRDGDKISDNCAAEIVEHRKILMTDYQLNPGLVKSCSAAIAEHCGNGIERNGATLHCLIRTAKRSFADPSIKISPECVQELRVLVKMVDPSEDIRVDPGLQEACRRTISGPCKDVNPGQGRVIECLLEELKKGDMDEDCQERLLEIQYFVARDWRLTPQLYKECKQDAVKLCSAKATWQDWSMDVDGGPLVLPCLFHHMGDDDEQDDDDRENQLEEKDELRSGSVSHGCQVEIRKLMLVRAQSIDLIPEVQDSCYGELARLCSHEAATQKGEELRCLQAKLHELDKDCRDAVVKYSVRESKDVRLDQILMRACKPIMDEFCADKKEDGRGELLECLIGQKNNPNIDPKCRAGIEHHQLLNMQSTNFNPKFRRMCRQEIKDHCTWAHSKIEVVRCLGDVMLNDTLLDQTHHLNDHCRQQLRFEYLQLNENLNLDEDFKKACEEDISSYCSEEKAGRGDLLECLRTKRDRLSVMCRNKFLERDRLNAIDQKSDYKLMSRCRDSIERYCDVTEENLDVIGCLRKHLLRPNLSIGCRKIVIDRIMEQNQDARLNPSLWAACHNDAKLGCHNEFAIAQDPNNPLNGRVLKCLKALFVNNRLSKKCELEVDQVMREAASVDYRLDPLLAEACTRELGFLCTTEPNNKKEDCLRIAFQNDRIDQGSKCFEEVRRIIVEGAADIFVDHELSELCGSDLTRYCSEVPPGASQQLKCLLSVKKAKKPLSVACDDKLESREELWRTAKVADSLTGFNDLARLINESEHRSYLLASLFFIVSAVFVLGCFCRPVVFRRRLDKMK